MNFSRIANAIDTVALETMKVAVFGVGGSADLCRQLLRCGVRQFSLCDFDVVGIENLCRQGYENTDVGRLKVDALRDSLRRIDPDVQVETVARDCTSLTVDELQELLADVGLLIMATDQFAAQAWGNRVALQYRIPAIWLGMYAGGGCGEIIFWYPQLKSCLRCLAPSRFRAHEVATPGRLDPVSSGVTIFDVGMTDAIAGVIAIALLTRGHDNRFGRVIEALGQRNFLQVKLDHAWIFNGRDIIREQLAIPPENSAYFSWNTIARCDPDSGNLPCPDCEQFRGHRFEQVNGQWQRIIAENER